MSASGKPLGAVRRFKGQRSFILHPSSFILVLVALVGMAGQASAQLPGKAPPSGWCPNLPPLTEKGPRPMEGPEGTLAFIDHLTNNDSAFEVVIGEGRILTTKEDLAAPGKQAPVIALGNPVVADFAVVGPRQIRVVGKRIGVTDLVVTTFDNKVYSFEVHVVYDLDILRARLGCIFPDACVKVRQLGNKVVVEGQARDMAQVDNIIQSVAAFLQNYELLGALAPLPAGGAAQGAAQAGALGGKGVVGQGTAQGGTGGGLARQEIINLLRVPGTQQVLLKVRVAELNRTAMRQIGADFLAVNKSTGTVVGSQIGGANITSSATFSSRILSAAAETAISPMTTIFGIFEEGEFAIFLSALRKNSLLKILAEPNLVTMNGHQAYFLAGGEFPVPVPQVTGTGSASTVTVQFQPFGVSLAFLPFILDNDVIRLTVDPEVSSIDFTLGTVLVPGGTPVPGLNTRKAHTVVELHQGETLAIAGLLQLTLDGSTARIPGLGDLPILGPFFSNTTSERIEKELVVLVTPYLVEGRPGNSGIPTPGDEVNGPTDFEFYLLNRIEGRTGRDFRATTEYDDALQVLRCFMKLQAEYVRGPYGYCD